MLVFEIIRVRRPGKMRLFAAKMIKRYTSPFYQFYKTRLL